MCHHGLLHCVIRAKTNAPTCKRRLLKLPSRVEQASSETRITKYGRSPSSFGRRAAARRDWRERVSWVAAVARVAVLSCWSLFIPRRRSSSRIVVVGAVARCRREPLAVAGGRRRCPGGRYICAAVGGGTAAPAASRCCSS